MSRHPSRTVYVGNLPGDIREREVKHLFMKYGHITRIDLKVPPRPPCYAFVVFKDALNAEDAIHGRDMNLMGADYGSKLHMLVIVIHLQEINTVFKAMARVVEEYLDTLNIAF